MPSTPLANDHTPEQHQAASAANDRYWSLKKRQVDGVVAADTACSAANADEWRMSHADLALSVDFPRQQLHCVAVITAAPAPGAGARAGTTLILDVHQLAVKAVTLPSEGDLALDFAVHPFSTRGSALHIALPPPDPGWGWSQLTLRIVYAAGIRSSSAFCWLPTARHAAFPFLLAHGGDRARRALFPCMDTPAVRLTWSVAVTAPAALRVLTSASSGNGAELPPLDPLITEEPLSMTTLTESECGANATVR